MTRFCLPLGFLGLLISASLGLQGCRSLDEALVRSQVRELRLLQTEALYLGHLQETLQARTAEPPDMGIFVSSSVVDDLLSGMRDLRLPLPGLRNTTVLVKDLRSDFKDGFPYFVLKAEAQKTGLDLVVELEVTATLQGVVSADAGDEVLLRPLVVDVLPVVQWGNLRQEIRGFVQELVQAKLGDYTEALPEIRLPLHSDLTLAVPRTVKDVSVPVQAGTLTGRITTSKFEIRRSLKATEVLFLSDGLHVLLAMDSVPGSAALTGLPTDLASPETRRLERKILEAHTEVDRLRKELSPVVEPLKVDDSDLQVWVSKSLLSDVTRAFGTLSDEQRRIQFQVIGQSGQLTRKGGGGLGCGYYVEIVDGNKAAANLEIEGLDAAWTDAGGIEVSGRLAADFQAKLHGHVNGAAGPCMVRNSLGFSSPTLSTHCRCPIGGGAGTTVGVGGKRTETLSARVKIGADEKSWLSYALELTGPSEIPITVEVGLEHVGNVGIPIKIPVPTGVLLKAGAPSVFGDRGSVRLPQPVGVEKVFEWEVRPLAGRTDATGYTASADVSLKWS